MVLNLKAAISWENMLNKHFGNNELPRVPLTNVILHGGEGIPSVIVKNESKRNKTRAIKKNNVNKFPR